MGVDAPADRAMLRTASVDGVAINFVAQFLRFGLQFVYQVILARLLTPRDFGLVAMAAPVLAFVTLFADFGLTQATVQRATITETQLNFIFWVNVGASGLLAACTIAIAPGVAWFYGEPRLTMVVVALGALFLFGGLYAQHLALLNRQLRFLTLAIVDIASFGVGAGLGIAAALSGYRYWAIVIAQGTTSCVALVLAWSCARWIPGRPASTSDARALLRFGGNITGFNAVNYFARNLDNVLIGRFSGEVALGLYDRAYKLLLLPLSQITSPFAKVATPVLSRTVQDSSTYERTYLRMLQAILLLTYPGVVFAACTSERLIPTVLGSQWTGVAPIFAVLAIGALFAPVSSSTGWLFVTQDRTTEMRNWGIVSSGLFVTSFVVGLPWGPLGVATCYIAVGTFQGPLLWWGATRRGPVRLRPLLAALFPFALAASITALAELGLKVITPAGVVGLAALAIGAHVIFVAVLASMSAGRAVLKDAVTQIAGVLHRLRQAAGPLVSRRARVIKTAA